MVLILGLDVARASGSQREKIPTVEWHASLLQGERSPSATEGDALRLFHASRTRVTQNMNRASARPCAEESIQAPRSGHVADLHFTVSHRQPKLIAIDKQPDDDVMHLG